MKTRNGIFTTMAVVLMMSLTVNVNAQGKGNGHAKGHDKHHKQDKHNARGYGYDNHHGYGKGREVHHHHHKQQPAHRHVHHVHHHHHSRDCGHSVVVYRYERPRYVYYRDYDVYYDNHRHVYISYAGRNWTISTSIPVRMHHVDVRRATRVEVEYYDDDFVTYIERGRPMYGKVYASW